ncbi:MAG: hypothetical protein C0595_10985 [Marinilabiliales bacterium]|nr:MAG: hypothetical protein C0595_10985 [Marinilabiliales bacterium]
MVNNTLSTNYSKYFSESKLLRKLHRSAEKLGIKLLFYVFILYFLVSDKDIPLKTRLVFMAALGYFILPMDLISDLLPGLGFTDDLTFILYALSTGSEYITEEIKEKDKTKINNMFNREHDYSFDHDEQNLLTPNHEE